MLNILNPTPKPQDTAAASIDLERRTARRRVLSPVYAKEPVRDTDIRDWLDAEEEDLQRGGEHALSAARVRIIGYGLVLAVVILVVVALVYVSKA